MTNQKYIEEIIKVAVQGDYCEKDFSESPIEIDIQQSNKHEYHVALKFKDNITDGIYYDLRGLLLDPNFFRAIGKVKGWEECCGNCGGYLIKDGRCGESSDCWNNSFVVKKWQHQMHTFLDKIIEKDLDHAIEWLYNLIKE